MRTKLLVLAMALILSACNFPVFSNPAAGIQPLTIEATGFQGEAVCVPNTGQSCVVVTTKTVSGGQTTSTYMIAEWVGPNPPVSITVKYNFRGLENKELELVPAVQKSLEGGVYDEDITVYAIMIDGHACEFRQGTNIFDCSKN